MSVRNMFAVQGSAVIISLQYLFQCAERSRVVSGIAANRINQELGRWIDYMLEISDSQEIDSVDGSDNNSSFEIDAVHLGILSWISCSLAIPTLFQRTKGEEYMQQSDVFFHAMSTLCVELRNMDKEYNFLRHSVRMPGEAADQSHSNHW